MNESLKPALVAVGLLVAFSCKKESSDIQSSITTGKNPPADLITDIDGKTYNFVFIHGQRWKTTNLAVSHYRNGDRIPQVKRTKDWRALTTGAWCWYNNDSATGAVYGKLYNWYAVNDPRGLAPTGWHVASNAEWDTLIAHLGGYYAFAGGRLKDTGTIEAGTGLWYAPNAYATNKTGFTGLPGGDRANDGTFANVGYHAFWWSSTPSDMYHATIYLLNYDEGGIHKGGGFDDRCGFSVRCIKDSI